MYSYLRMRAEVHMVVVCEGQGREAQGGVCVCVCVLREGGREGQTPCGVLFVGVVPVEGAVCV